LKKYLWLILILVFLLSGLCLAAASKQPALPGNLLAESPKDYVDRMIETIRYFVDSGYYTEASFLLSDLKKTNEPGLNGGAVAELETKLNSLYSPEKENSWYNSDVLIKAKDFTGKYGYIDSTGKFAVEAKYDQAEEFAEGLALVKIGDQKLFINRKGETVIQFKPEERVDIRSGFNSGLALCYYNGSGSKHEEGYGYIDKQGNEKIFLPKRGKFTVSYDGYSFSEGFAVVKDTDKNLCGYIDTDGKWLVEPTFSKAFGFQNGMAMVMYPNMKVLGYINTSGKPAFRPSLMDAWSFMDDCALVETAEGIRYIDKSGNITYNPDTLIIDKKPCGKSVDIRSDGLIPFRAYEGNGHNDLQAIIFVDKNNKRSLALVERRDVYYSGWSGDHEVIGFANGRAFIRTKYDFGWAMIDLKGNFILKPQGDWTPKGKFRNGLAKVEFRADKSIGYIDRDGKLVYKE
jgi:hypothetical protein